jgi:hypothetical protein
VFSPPICTRDRICCDSPRSDQLQEAMPDPRADAPWVEMSHYVIRSGVAQDLTACGCVRLSPRRRKDPRAKTMHSSATCSLHQIREGYGSRRGTQAQPSKAICFARAEQTTPWIPLASASDYHPNATRHASPPSAPGATIALNGMVAAAGNPAACAWPLHGV